MRTIVLHLILIMFTNTYGQISNMLSNEDKIFGLSKFWQEVNYNFVYYDKVDKKAWNDQYKALITMVQQSQNDYEYYKMLQKYCATLKDGHTNIYLPKHLEGQELVTMFGDYRMVLQNINGKAIVIKINVSKKDALPVGSEIIEINGMSTADYANQHVRPYISASTTYVLDDLTISNLLRGLVGAKYFVKFKKPNGDIVKLDLIHSRSVETEMYPSEIKNYNTINLEWKSNGIAYLAVNNFENNALDSLIKQKLPELVKAKALIIDLRNNGGGDSRLAVSLLKYFINDTILYGTRSICRQHIPPYKAWGKGITPADTVNYPLAKYAYLNYNDNLTFELDYYPDTIKEKIDRIIIPTAILIGHQTASSAEDFLIYAHHQKHMKKIGENTYGSTGQPLWFDMPGGGSARVCTVKSIYYNGDEFVGTGIKPDIEVIPTLNDFLNKNDATLEKAIEYLKSRLHE